MRRITNPTDIDEMDSSLFYTLVMPDGRSINYSGEILLPLIRNSSSQEYALFYESVHHTFHLYDRSVIVGEDVVGMAHTIEEEIRRAEESALQYLQIVETNKRKLASLEDRQSNKLDIVELLDKISSWPDVMAVAPFRSVTHGVGLEVTLNPAVISETRERVKIIGVTTPITLVLTGISPFIFGKVPSIHPHLGQGDENMRICLGEAQDNLFSLLLANKPLEAIQLLSLWKIGYNPSDLYNHFWGSLAATYAKRVRQGILVDPHGWDGDSFYSYDGSRLTWEEVVERMWTEDEYFGQKWVLEHFLLYHSHRNPDEIDITDRFCSLCDNALCKDCHEIYNECTCIGVVYESGAGYYLKENPYCLHRIPTITTIYYDSLGMAADRGITRDPCPTYAPYDALTQILIEKFQKKGLLLDCSVRTSEE